MTVERSMLSWQKARELILEQSSPLGVETLDLAHRMYHKPNELSGGQQQRVAIARAIVNDPVVIMGDEPTGNLDTANTNIVFDIVQELAHSYGQTIIAVTHDKEFAANSDRTIVMSDGQIVSQ